MDGRRPVVASLRGLVVAGHPQAAAAGARLLRAGGNAFDAAAATAAALGVVLPYACGPGGFGVAICHLAAEERVRVLDFLPRRALGPAGGGTGPAARVGLPAALGGWFELARAHGKKRPHEVFAPAVALARDGAVLIERPARALEGLGALAEPLEAALHGPATARVLRLPRLARTLEQFAAEGPEWLTHGAFGRAFAAFVTAQGGQVTAEDLATLAPAWTDPISTPWRDLALAAPPPSSQGFAALLALRLAGKEALAPALARAEAARAAAPQPDAPALAHLFTEESLAALRAEEPAPPAAPRRPPVAGLVVADAEGNLVALAQSLGGAFGARLALPESGVLLGNALGWGAPPEGTPPACALAPLLALRNGAPVLAAAGTGAAQVVRAWASGATLPEAVAAPRLGDDAAEVVALARDTASGVLLAGVDPRGESDAVPV